jgi:CHAT domain-containing protein
MAQLNISLLLSLLLLACTGSYATETPPPRTIDDITRLLDHYKPDPLIAAKALAEANREPPVTEARKALFDFYWQRGQAAVKVGRASQQISDLRKTLEFGEQGSEPNAYVLGELAFAEAQGGNLLNAVRRAEESVANAQRLRWGFQVGSHAGSVSLLSEIGDLPAARNHMRELDSTMTMIRRSNDWSDYQYNWTAVTENARGVLFSAEGKLAEGEAAFRRALQSSALAIPLGVQIRAQGRAHPSAEQQLRRNEMIQRNLSTALLANGRVVEAEVIARQALRHTLERIGRNSVDTGASLQMFAQTIAEQGRYAESEKLLREAIKSFQAGGAAPESMQLAKARRGLGAALVSQGKYGEALKVFDEMRAGLQADPMLLKKVGSGDLDWVLAMLRSGKQSEAEAMAATMYERAKQNFADNIVRSSEIRAFHAMTLAARGERELARNAFREALPPLIEQARNDAENETGGIRRQQRLVIILESYLRLLSETPDAAAEAFLLADIARGSAVQKALTSSAARATIHDPKLAELARREQDAQQRANSLSGLLTQLISSPPEQQLPAIQAQLRKDIETLKAARLTLQREIGERFPDYANLVSPKPASMADAQKSLRTDEALVAFYFGEQEAYAWAMRGQGVPAFVKISLSRKQMAGEVARLRRALDPGVSSIDEIPAFEVAAAHRLYSQLLEPLAATWRGAKVLIAVSHAELGQLPLALLPTALVAQPVKTGLPFAGYRAVPWLMRSLAVEQLPSVTSLASLRKLPPGNANRRSFIGFGDPLFSAEQARQAGIQLASAEAPGSVKTRGVPLRLRNAPKTSGVDSAELALLPRLPDTSQEVREIAEVLQADPAQDVFLQAQASEKTVLGSDLSQRKVVMFATHGLVPGELNGLNQPALALSAPELSGSEGDGLLTMDKILSLKLNADWVVLSACNTASGDGSGSEAVSGLGRAFFYAGARALLVSNWPVETVSARLLMTDLFRRQTATPGLAKAEALRAAMGSLIDGAGSIDAKTGKADYSYAHPLFWAPFVVVGD